MEWREDQEKGDVFESVKGALLMLAFGLGVLMFLVGIKQTEWFHLRPASGTATAMSNASDLDDRPRVERTSTAAKTAEDCSPGALPGSRACAGAAADQ